MPPTENILLIGDTRREMRSAIEEAITGATVTAVEGMFDGIAELSLSSGDAQRSEFTTVLAAAEPIERRPEAAVRTLRELAGNSRLVLFGHPTLELLSRKMLKFGCDDYLVTPANRSEIQHVLGTPNPRLVPPPAPPAAPQPASAADVNLTGRVSEEAIADTMVTASGDVDFTAVGNTLLQAMLEHPHDPIGWTLRVLSLRLSPGIELSYAAPGKPSPAGDHDHEILSHPVGATGGMLHARFTFDADAEFARDLLHQLAIPAAHVAALHARHAALQNMAISDDLTGVYNARYFRHFLHRILQKARQMHFPVTLLLFDIDDFKTYNDQFGHQVGDEILKQTAALMKRCTREHDLVARIGGDEFAVVFWDKEGPRQPREPRPGIVSRPPASPVQIFERFKRMIQSDEFTALGSHGQGKLGISAGLAVYPWDADEVSTLVAAADKALMQGAKKHAKNRLSLVGNGTAAPPI
jgi:GGDEF domain-containing protein